MLKLMNHSTPIVLCKCLASYIFTWLYVGIIVSDSPGGRLLEKRINRLFLGCDKGWEALLNSLAVLVRSMLGQTKCFQILVSKFASVGRL
jgi:hypothetical protein